MKASAVAGPMPNPPASQQNLVNARLHGIVERAQPALALLAVTELAVDDALRQLRNRTRGCTPAGAAARNGDRSAREVSDTVTNSYSTGEIDEPSRFVVSRNGSRKSQ